MWLSESGVKTPKSEEWNDEVKAPIRQLTINRQKRDVWGLAERGRENEGK